MSAIFAGDVAKAAVDALALIDLGDDLVRQVEIRPVAYLGRAMADEIVELGKAFLAHPALES